MDQRLRAVMGVGTLLLACGGNPAGDTAPRSPAERRQEAPLPSDHLRRADVIAIVDQGLGAFLQRIQVEPSLAGGKFEGFRVTALLPEGFWGRTDLKLGDVVTHVNGTFLEDPGEAWTVFESLRTAPELKVRLLRDGQPRELVFPIVGETG